MFEEYSAFFTLAVYVCVSEQRTDKNVLLAIRNNKTQLFFSMSNVCHKYKYKFPELPSVFSIYPMDFHRYSQVCILLLPIEGTSSQLYYIIKLDTHANPFLCPRFRLSASGSSQLTAFAFGVPVDINGFHPYTDRSISP